MEIKTIGVVGCGIMGSGIAQVCAQSGRQVVVSDLNDELLNKGLASINSILSGRVDKGKMSQEEKDTIVGRITGTIDVKGFAACDFIIEAVTEKLDVKKEVFAQLDKVCRKDIILSTNTSSMSIIDIAMVTGRPDKVAGMHFNNPAPVMRILEIVRSIATSEETLEECKAMGQALGKTIVVAPDVPGFIGARLATPYIMHAIRMYESGIGSKEDIDNSMTLGFNHPMGPLALVDLIGLDTELNLATYLYDELKEPQYAPPVLLKKMVAAGRLGRKSGKGFYDYT